MFKKIERFELLINDSVIIATLNYGIGFGLFYLFIYLFIELFYYFE